MGFLEHSAELNETNVELAKDTDVIYKYNFGFGKKHTQVVQCFIKCISVRLFTKKYQPSARYTKPMSPA